MQSTLAASSRAPDPLKQAINSLGAGLAGPTAKRRDELVQELCECVIDITAALFSVSSKEIRKCGRTPMPAARVRQIAMYVAHVVLRLSMREVGRGFGRHRTAVVHTCAVIEDLRDDPDFDHVVAVAERVVFAAFRNRLGL